MKRYANLNPWHDIIYKQKLTINLKYYDFGFFFCFQLQSSSGTCGNDNEKPIKKGAVQCTLSIETWWFCGIGMLQINIQQNRKRRVS